MIAAYDAGDVVELPGDTPEAAVPLRIDEGDAIREEPERRVIALLRR